MSSRSDCRLDKISGIEYTLLCKRFPNTAHATQVGRIARDPSLFGLCVSPAASSSEIGCTSRPKRLAELPHRGGRGLRPPPGSWFAVAKKFVHESSRVLPCARIACRSRYHPTIPPRGEEAGPYRGRFGRRLPHAPVAPPSHVEAGAGDKEVREWASSCAKSTTPPKRGGGGG